jgi:monothiol glutaredoxin
MSAIHDLLKSIVDKNDVVLFMKGTPNFPQCGFSGQLVQILHYLDVNYEHVNCLETDEIRQGIKSFSNWPTIPQLYIKGEFVGGCDIVREMFQSGELAQTFAAKGIEYKIPAAPAKA